MAWGVGDLGYMSRKGKLDLPCICLLYGTRDRYFNMILNVFFKSQGNTLRMETDVSHTAEIHMGTFISHFMPVMRFSHGNTLKKVTPLWQYPENKRPPYGNTLKK